MAGVIETRTSLWNHEHHAALRGMELEAVRREWVQKLRVMHGLPPIADWTPKGTVEAEIHRGWWAVPCPVPGCASAEMADPEWPVFVCSGGCGYGPLKVVFPKRRKEIEALLLARPVPATRNWLKTETVKDIKQENERLAEDFANARKLMGSE